MAVGENGRAAIFACELLGQWSEVTPLSAVTLSLLEDLGQHMDCNATADSTLNGQ